jgi:hypothetical protein
LLADYPADYSDTQPKQLVALVLQFLDVYGSQPGRLAAGLSNKGQS